MRSFPPSRQIKSHAPQSLRIRSVERIGSNAGKHRSRALLPDRRQAAIVEVTTANAFHAEGDDANKTEVAAPCCSVLCRGSGVRKPPVCLCRFLWRSRSDVGVGHDAVSGPSLGDVHRKKDASCLRLGVGKERILGDETKMRIIAENRTEQASREVNGNDASAPRLGKMRT